MFEVKFAPFNQWDIWRGLHLSYRKKPPGICRPVTLVESRAKPYASELTARRLHPPPALCICPSGSQQPQRQGFDARAQRVNQVPEPQIKASTTNGSILLQHTGNLRERGSSARFSQFQSNSISQCCPAAAGVPRWPMLCRLPAPPLQSRCGPARGHVTAKDTSRHQHCLVRGFPRPKRSNQQED